MIQSGTCTPMFIAVMSIVAKIWNEPKCPSTDEWIKKMWYIETLEYYSAIKKNEILPFAMIWTELQCIMLSEVSQSEKDKIPYDFTYMWNLRNKQMNTGKGKDKNREGGKP